MSSDATATARRTGPVSGAEANERDNRVLQVAGEEFLSQGFLGANMDVIARRSNVSKQTIYRQFGGKDQLFKSFIASRMSGFRYNLGNTLASGRPIREVIGDIVGLIVDGVSNDSSLAILTLAVTERNRFPIFAQIVLDDLASLRAPLAAYLREHATWANEAEADRLAFHLMNMAAGGFSFLLGGKPLEFGDRALWIESVVDSFLLSLDRASRAHS